MLETGLTFKEDICEKVKTIVSLRLWTKYVRKNCFKLDLSVVELIFIHVQVSTETDSFILTLWPPCVLDLV